MFSQTFGLIKEQIKSTPVAFCVLSDFEMENVFNGNIGIMEGFTCSFEVCSCTNNLILGGEYALFPWNVTML